MNDTAYTNILQAIQQLPFTVGKRTIIDIVSGSVNKKMISNDAYMDAEMYDSLSHIDTDTIDAWITELLRAKCLHYVSSPKNPRWKMLDLTPEGIEQIQNPTLHKKEVVGVHTATLPDQEETSLMKEFSFFLSSFTKQQQHAIITPKKHVLCVAGAGSGKTTVLTNRVRFLTKYRGVTADNVLAITFTRKAREEMQNRLGEINAHVVTFNGFCERVLRANQINKPIISYGQKIMLFREACKKESIEIPYLIREYYTATQRKGHNNDELARRLMSDIFSIIDHYANEDEDIPSSGDTVLASTLLAIARSLTHLMDKRGVMDYSGQLKETLKLFRKYPEKIPSFSHVLVDEYQDVNVAQVRLLELLNSTNLFVVGDPRQSIFGWRGSHVSFINDFEGDCVVQLTENFRSSQKIVDVMNQSIDSMQLPKLQAAKETDGAVQVLSYSSETEEIKAIAGLLKHVQSDSVFVLARTNRQLEDLSTHLIRLDINHDIRHETDEGNHSGITLATVHAIKGLEAHTVIVMGCTSRFFPCRVSDHPVVELLTGNSVMKEDEELRLLYVALSRAEENLIVTYSNSLTYLLDGAFSSESATLKTRGRDDGAYDALKEWRSSVAKQKSLPAYCIFADKTLRELATIKPSNPHELEAIYGVGPSKAKQYGEEIISVLAEF
jgi:superfamily I DNA/RNA helicase